MSATLITLALIDSEIRVFIQTDCAISINCFQMFIQLVSSCTKNNFDCDLVAGTTSRYPTVGTFSPSPFPLHLSPFTLHLQLKSIFGLGLYLQHILATPLISFWFWFFKLLLSFYFSSPPPRSPSLCPWGTGMRINFQHTQGASAQLAMHCETCVNFALYFCCQML